MEYKTSKPSNKNRQRVSLVNQMPTSAQEDDEHHNMQTI
jgi:hypothetical protein